MAKKTRKSDPVIRNIPPTATVTEKAIRIRTVGVDENIKPDNIVHCPFTKMHTMRFSTYHQHVLKCPERGNFTSCPYNSVEFFKDDTLMKHIQTCKYNPFQRCTVVKRNMITFEKLANFEKTFVAKEFMKKVDNNEYLDVQFDIDKYLNSSDINYYCKDEDHL